LQDTELGFPVRPQQLRHFIWQVRLHRIACSC
jgi:hypothetical protein